ncbi:MAG: hypothetical protein QHC90_13255 [Shinella sp.]|nr:hypothetical protein [Shinella sp.]
MNIHTPEHQRQMANVKAVRERLFNPALKTGEERNKALRKENENLREQIAGMTKMISAYERELISASLDISEYQAIVLEQAKRLCDIEGIDINKAIGKRPVKEIIRDVLYRFPRNQLGDDYQQVTAPRTRDAASSLCLSGPHPAAGSFSTADRKDFRRPRSYDDFSVGTSG